MANIAIIDDWINPKYVSSSAAIKYIYVNENEIVNETLVDEVTHATIVATVLDYYAIDYEITNIVLSYKMNEGINICKLEKALQICVNEKIDIICMSLGTVFVSEGMVIERLIKDLYKKNVIMIAATDNDERYMIPAAMKEVIGVGVEWTNQIEAGDYVNVKHNFCNMNVAVNCNWDIKINEKKIYPSTSCAVPVIAAKVNLFLNKGYKGKWSIMQQLEIHSKKKNYVKEKVGVCTLNEFEIPIVVLKGLAVTEYIEFVDTMNQLDGIEAMGIDSTGKIKDYRFFNEDKKMFIENILFFIRFYTTINIVFWVQSNNNIDGGSDIVVWKNKEKYYCIINDEGKKECFEKKNEVCMFIRNVLT